MSNVTITGLIKNGKGIFEKKGFVAAITLTLGVTLGCLLCIVSLNYLLLYKSLSYPAQEQLFISEQVLRDQNGKDFSRSLYYPALQYIYKKQSFFEKAAVIDYARDIITSHPSQPLVYVSYVTPEYGDIFDVQLEKGRFFTGDEGLDSHTPVVVISYEAWLKDFDLRQDILDHKITLAGGVSFKIIGVTARNFIEPQLKEIGRNTHVWLPWDYNIATKYWGWSSVADSLFLVGKLGSNTSKSQVEQQLSRLLSDKWHEELVGNPVSYKDWTISMELRKVRDVILGDSKSVAYMLLAGMVGLVFIACVNISSLLMSRIAEQQRKFSIHVALGAKKRDIFTIVLCETTILMALSLLLALLVSLIGFFIVHNNLYKVIPRVAELGLDVFTIISAFIFAGVLAIFFAFIGAHMLDYKKLSAAINTSGKGSGLQVSKKVRFTLVACQVCLASTILFLNINLFSQSYAAIFGERGYKINGLHNIYLNFSAFENISPEEMKNTAIDVRNKIANLPSVEEVSQGHSPLQPYIDSALTSVISENRYSISLKNIDHKYFNLLDRKLIDGSNFSASGIRDYERVMLVNETFAAQLLSKEDRAIGLLLSRNGGEPFRIIGVVNDIQFPNAPRDTPRAYFPASEAGFNFIVKYANGNLLSRQELVEAIQKVSSRLSVFLYDSLEEQEFNMMFSQVVLAAATLILTIVVVTLAGIGLYGIVNYSTQLRKFEIGTRMALGAKSASLIKMIFRENLVSASWGMLAGFTVLMFISLSIDGFLYKLLSLETLFAFACAFGTMLILIGVACYMSIRVYCYKPVIYSLRSSDDSRESF